ncbi:MAG: rhodanese-related sulfurtransferase [Stappiaceae bacterium]
MTKILVAALYKFVSLPDFEVMQETLLTEAKAHGIAGSLLLAEEGINGTIAGEADNLQSFLEYLKTYPRLAELDYKTSHAEKMPFKRMKVRLKKEIVPLGVEGIDPNKTVGTYVDPADWNSLIRGDDVVVIDTRNSYEIAFGTFKDAVDPKTRTFRQFASWAEKSDALFKDKKIAMFCTGGIRCEKATSLMKELGYEDVYHLKGGILKYLEEIPKPQSLWEGECFVFDDRISVDHEMEAQWGAYVPPEAHSAVYPAPKMSPEEKQRRRAEREKLLLVSGREE